MKIFKKSVLGFLLIASFILSGCGKSLEHSTLQQEATTTQTTDLSEHMMGEAMLRTEQDFILQMIPHHQEAIESSQLLLEKTSDPDLKKFATEVIKVQTLEVTQMKQWLKDWYSQEYTVNNSYMPMMGDLSTGSSTEVEIKYISGMIVHHQGAVDMAEAVLQLQPAPRSETQEMAKNIISVQTKEIEQLQMWLQTKYPETSPIVEGDHGPMGH
jgi:uncharacterized protein (DUF305 family)